MYSNIDGANSPSDRNSRCYMYHRKKSPSGDKFLLRKLGNVTFVLSRNCCVKEAPSYKTFFMPNSTEL